MRFDKGGAINFFLHKNMTGWDFPFGSGHLDLDAGRGQLQYKGSIGQATALVGSKNKLKCRAFGIKRRYYDKPAKQIMGTFTISASGSDAFFETREKLSIQITFKHPDWKEYTSSWTCYAAWSRPPRGVYGKNFKVKVVKLGHGKAGVGGAVGNVHVKDTDLNLERTYKLAVAGLAPGIGASIWSPSSYTQLQPLKTSCPDWTGAKITMWEVGGAAAVKLKYGKTKITLRTGETVTFGGVDWGLEIGANFGGEILEGWLLP